ncbi:MAG: hypothetical protein V1655_01500 [bacterium]
MGQTSINFQKIKEEFVKTENKIKAIFCGLGASFILFIILIIFLFFSSNTSAKDSIISYLPDNTIFYAHIASLSNDKTTDFFADQMVKYLKIEKNSAYNKIFPFLGQEAAIAVLQNNNEAIPFFIFKNPATSESHFPNFPDTEKDLKIKNLTNKNLTVLSANNNEFKSNSGFKNISQIKKFAKKYSPDLTFYIDINKIYSTENNISILDNAVLEEMKNKGEILVGVKKINDSYEMSIADIEQNILSKIKLQNNDEKKYGENIIFSAQTNAADKISVLPENFFKYFPDLENEKMEIILTSSSNEQQKNNSDASLRNQLMLNGENSPLQYIITLKNNTKNQENLEKIKTFFINYLDEKIPEEKVASLPDSSLMTELWSNPERFKFNAVAVFSSPYEERQPDRAILEGAECSLYLLKNNQLNFEFAYSETKNTILLSNSENALKNYLSRIPDFAIADSTDFEAFFINTEYLRNEGIIINALNYFGNYADGIIKMP